MNLESNQIILSGRTTPISIAVALALTMTTKDSWQAIGIKFKRLDKLLTMYFVPY